MVRFGIIGTNWITEAFIAAAQQSEHFALTAVYSRTEEKGRAFADKFAIREVYTDLDAFAASDAFDAVYIASPNAFHARQAVLCMNHRKHVLCEKPAASNAREFRTMMEAAQANGVLLMEAMKSTLLPNFLAIQANLPKLGPIRRYFASYCQYSSRYDAYKQGVVMNAFDPQFSNGALMDLGIYCLYPLIVLFGKPDRVQASAVMLESGVDGEGSLLLSYAAGMDGVVMYSKITTSYAPAEIQGEHATMVIDKINEPGKVEIRYRDGRVEDITVPQPHSSMYYEAAEFMALLLSDRAESSNNAHANSLASLEVMDEARKQTGLVFPADLAER